MLILLLYMDLLNFEFESYYNIDYEVEKTKVYNI